MCKNETFVNNILVSKSGQSISRVSGVWKSVSSKFINISINTKFYFKKK